MFEGNHRAAEREANSKKRAEAQKGSSHSRRIAKSGESPKGFFGFLRSRRRESADLEADGEGKFFLPKAGASLK